jgi:pyruvate formate lyase activating enzyme
MDLPTTQSVALRQLLAENTAPAANELIRDEGAGAVRCLACGHRCKVLPGRHGVCHVRFNDHGVLKVPFGYVSSIAVDPIEKKPFYHAFPGAEALSFGMLGCDFHCGYCQNWITSQTLRNDEAIASPHYVSAERIVELALAHGCPVLTSTYNEPLITSEWAVEVFRLGQQHGLVGSYVSNGNATPEVLEYIRPYVDLYKIDLKSFRDKAYRELGGTLRNVLDTIRRTKQMGFWVEDVTLVVPGFNSSDDEFKQIAEFLASVSPEIPWHVTAFHPDYKMSAVARTSAQTLLRATQIGRRAGLKFVYPGNLPGLVGDLENTHCPACNALLIERTGFMVRNNFMLGPNCPACGARVPGVWQDDPPKASRGRGVPRPVRS